MAQEKEKKPLTKAYTKTPQSLVHIKHNISALQYKYWLLALKSYGEAFQNQTLELDENGFFVVDMKKIIELLGYEPKKSEIKKDLEEIRKEPIIINFLEKDGKPATHGMGFISEWKVSSTKVLFKFPSFVVKAITEEDENLKKMFLQMNWNIFNSFSGKYEAIIYKLCKDYIGTGRTPLFSVEKYREYIGLQEGEYKETRDFTKKCINFPIKNINKSELADITVAVHFEKKGRRITGLYFTMEKKEKAPLPLPAIEPSPAFKNAIINITAEQQTKYLERYTAEEIEAIIERANNYVFELKEKNKNVNIGAIYARAFADGWGLENLEEKRKQQREAEVLAKRKAQEQEK